MPIPTLVTDLSTTAGSNSPSGSDSPIDGDNFIRALSAFIRQNYNSITQAQDSWPHVMDYIPYGTDLASTDVTTYVQNGLTDLEGTGKYLRVTNGTYRISSRLVVPTGTGIVGDKSGVLYALNAGFTNVNPDTYETSTSTVLQLTGQTSSPFTPNYDQKIVGIKIEYQFLEGRSCNAIAARNCHNLEISDVEITGFAHSKCIIAASLGGPSRIVNNYIHDIASNTVFASHPTFADRGFVNITGIDIDDDAINSVTSDGLLVAFNHIENLHHGTTAVATYGDQADGIYQNKGTGARFIGNKVLDTNEGLDLLGADGVVDSNYVADCGNFGIKLIHGAKRNRVRSNTIVRSGLAGIWVGANDVTANGNTSFNIIEDNVIRDIDPDDLNSGATTACLKVESTGGGVVGSNNNFVRNYCDPGTFGEYVIVNNSSGDVNNVFERNHIAAAGVSATYLVLAANNFDITPRIKTKTQVTRSSNQAITTGSVSKVTFNSAIVDVLSEFDVTTNNRWVCTHPGYYLVDFRVGMSLCRGLYVHIYKNGSAIATTAGIDSATDVIQGGFTRFLVYMSVADYLEGWVEHASGSNRNVIAGVANTYFAVVPA